jgi:hypothetical protein
MRGLFLLLVPALVPAMVAVAGADDDSCAARRVTAPVAAPRANEVRSTYERAIAAPEDSSKRDELAKVLPYVPGLDAYVLEGDVLIKAKKLQRYLTFRHDEREKLARSKGQRNPADTDPLLLRLLLSPELKVNYVLGHPDVWEKSDRAKLSYAVDLASFGGNTREYDLVVKNVRLAADGWEQLCPTCGVRLTYVANADAAPTFDKAMIIVKRFDAERKFIAQAPFPSTPVDERYLYVDPSYFETEYDPVGVFRHELGHVLGYRHEQIDELSGCYHTEDNEWQSLSTYDPCSVMHYFCEGHGSLSLAFTDTDRTSHATLYAP